MIRNTLIIGLMFVFNCIFGQASKNDLSQIKTVSQAKAFIDKNPKAYGKIFITESSTDTSEIISPLYGSTVGFTFKILDFNYKVLQIDTALSFRVSYIYLNGDLLAKNQIDSIRREIILKYKSGKKFFELAEQYTMDGNKSGDLNWFRENMMMPEFETSIRQHTKGEIFTVDIPSRKWYYVVLKTFDDTFIKKLTILRIKNIN